MPNKNFTLKQIHNLMVDFLKNSQIDSAIQDTQIFLMDVLGFDKKIDIYLNSDLLLNRQEISKLREYLRQRKYRKPVAYIIGKAWFWEQEFIVNRDTLIPERETELLVEKGIEIIRELSYKAIVLDVGTGCGNIAISLSKSVENTKCIAIDKSRSALSITQINISKHKLDSNVVPIMADMCELPFKTETFDLIISNPPYISSEQFSSLPAEVHFEPRIALLGGKTGTELIERLLISSKRVLKKNGILIFEIGFDQKESVKQLIERQKCWEIIEIIKDYGKNFRGFVLKLI